MIATCLVWYVSDSQLLTNPNISARANGVRAASAMTLNKLERAIRFLQFATGAQTVITSRKCNMDWDTFNMPRRDSYQPWHREVRPITRDIWLWSSCSIHLKSKHKITNKFDNLSRGRKGKWKQERLNDVGCTLTISLSMLWSLEE